MQAQQVTVKIFADADRLDQGELIPVFHRWIQEGRLQDTLLIDVADYRHVPEGPGVMLIAHGAHYGLDEGDDESGLLFSRKGDPPGDVADKLDEALRRAFEAAAALEKEPSLVGQVRFRPGDIRVQIASRLLVSNDDATFQELRPLVEDLAGRLYPDASVTVERASEDPRSLFGVRIRAETSDDTATVAARL